MALFPDDPLFMSISNGYGTPLRTSEWSKLERNKQFNRKSDAAAQSIENRRLINLAQAAKFYATPAENTREPGKRLKDDDDDDEPSDRKDSKKPHAQPRTEYHDRSKQPPEPNGKPPKPPESGLQKDNTMPLPPPLDDSDSEWGSIRKMGPAKRYCKEYWTYNESHVAAISDPTLSKSFITNMDKQRSEPKVIRRKAGLEPEP